MYTSVFFLGCANFEFEALVFVQVLRQRGIGGDSFDRGVHTFRGGYTLFEGGDAHFLEEGMG